MSESAIFGSECDLLRSEITGREYEVSVWRPPAGDQPMPVLFVTDGNLMFPAAASIASLLIFGGEIPPLQVVSIGYPSGGDVSAANELRRKDLRPQRGTPNEGAAGFVGFMRQELTPWLEARYALSDDRTLFGASAGGLFALFVLFNCPGHFRRYVIVSPGIGADAAIYTDEARLAEATRDLEVAISFQVGLREDQVWPACEPSLAGLLPQLDFVGHTKRMVELLVSRSYNGLRLESTFVDGQTHFSMPFVGLANGLRDVFSDICPAPRK